LDIQKEEYKVETIKSEEVLIIHNIDIKGEVKKERGDFSYN